MKKNKLTIVTALIFVLSFGSMLSGCQSNEEKPIATVNNKDLYLDDFMYDIYMVEAEGKALDEYYRNNNAVYDNYWDLELEGVTMRESARETVLSRVIMYEILSQEALEIGIALTEAEVGQNETAIKTLIETMSEERLERIGLSYEILRNAYQKISLGDKYYLQLANTFPIDKEVIRNNTSFDEYREYKTECIYVSTVSVENQNVNVLGEEEMAKAFETINEAKEAINEETNLEAIAQGNDFITYYTRDFIFEKSNYEKPYQEAALLLENGQYSDIVSTNFGYYIIRMLDNNSDAKYEEAIQDAITAEEQAQFSDFYNELKDQYSITINEDYWNSIDIGSITLK